VVFARRRSIQQAIVEIGDASSGFLQSVAMAFRGDQRSQLVHRQRDPLLAYAAPTQIRYKTGPRTVRSPSAKPAFTDVG
jgi:hypothetical protein